MTDITATQALDFSELLEEVITTRNADQWENETGETFQPPRPRPLADATEALRSALQGLIVQVSTDGAELAVVNTATKAAPTS